MIGPLGYFLWILTGLLQAAVVVLALRAKCFLRYFSLNFYMVCACIATAGRYFVFRHYGLDSNQYRYFFYYSDLLLTVCLYFTLTWLFSEVFRELGAGKYVRLTAIAVLVITAAVSLFIVRTAEHRLITKFAGELSQNLYFVGAMFTYLLWASMVKLHKTETRLVHVVLALGVYFSAYAASFAFGNLYPHSWLWRPLAYVAALWLPVAWGYAFLRVPRDAQLSPAQIAAGRV